VRYCHVCMDVGESRMPCGMHNACQLSIHHGAYIGPTVEGSMSLLVHHVTPLLLWAAFLQPVKAQISMSAHLHPQDMEGIDDPNANQGGADENAAANAAAAAATAAAAAAAAAQAQALADAEAAAAAVEAQALAAARNKGPANTGPAPWARDRSSPQGFRKSHL
jgi:hypothetical protein